MNRKYYVIVFADMGNPTVPFDINGKPCPGMMVYHDIHSANEAISQFVKGGYFHDGELKAVMLGRERCCGYNEPR